MYGTKLQANSYKTNSSPYPTVVKVFAADEVLGDFHCRAFGFPGRHTLRMARCTFRGRVLVARFESSNPYSWG